MEKKKENHWWFVDKVCRRWFKYRRFYFPTHCYHFETVLHY